MGLLADFRAAAVGGHRFPDDGRLTPASLFALVRDMPYQAADTDVGAAVREWRASGCTKHALLHELYREFGLQSILIQAAHEISVASWPWLPRALRDELEAGPVADVYTFLRVQVGSEWMAIDATWPTRLVASGTPMNERFEPGRDMRVACDPDELFHVPDETDPAVLRAELLGRLSSEQLERHSRFFGALEHWLAVAVSPEPR